MTTTPPAPAAPRPRSRRAVGRWLVVVALLVLIGRGLGLAGRAPTPAGGATEPGLPAAAVAVAPAPGSGDSLASATAPEPTPQRIADVPPPAAPATEPAPSPVATPSPEPPPPAAATASPQAASGCDPDRFASLVSTLAFHTERGELGSALATLQHLRHLPLDGAQRTVLLASEQSLDTALAAAAASLVQQLCAGQALAAHEQLAQWFADGDLVMAPWLDAAVLAAGLPGGLFRGLVAGDLAAPLARPIVRGSEVRVHSVPHHGIGTVVDSRADRVTVRLQTANGWSFPTVPAIVCEPVQPSADDAIEAGLRAVHAKSPLLARVWLAIARLRRPGALGDRGEQLARLLP